nr:E3 ubiquitin-protein ligase ATL23-like [Tanacetum cinerariifolium]
MLLSVFLALFLPCAGMSLVFIIYICLLCYAARYHQHQPNNTVTKPVTENGLSKAELERLPITKGKDLVLGNECAVCLDDVEPEQEARMFPGCNHGFHLQCADTWLAKNPVCPVCRNKLDAGFFAPPETNPC